MDTNFAPHIFPMVPIELEHDPAAIQVIDDFKTGWTAIAKHVGDAAAEVRRLKSVFTGQVRPAELKATKTALHGAEDALRDAEIEFCISAIELLTKLFEQWPPTFLMSCQVAYDLAYAEISIAEKAVRDRLGASDPIPGQRDDARPAIFADKDVSAARLKATTLQTFIGRLPAPADAIENEINRISAALESAKRELLAA